MTTFLVSLFSLQIYAENMCTFLFLEKKLKFFKFIIFLKKCKIPQIIGGLIEKFNKKFFPKIKMYTHVCSINLKGKVSETKNVVTALIYFCNYPYGTHCNFTIKSVAGSISRSRRRSCARTSARHIFERHHIKQTEGFSAV